MDELAGDIWGQKDYPGTGSDPTLLDVEVETIAPDLPYLDVEVKAISSQQNRQGKFPTLDKLYYCEYIYIYIYIYHSYKISY